jgi:exodeoxyribonuclease VII large subunit
VASSSVPVVSAVGHEQDTPLCDLAADVRASTPTHAARLVVPDAVRLRESLERSHANLARGARGTVERHAVRLQTSHERLRRAPLLSVERKEGRLATLHGQLSALSPSATLERGYAIVRRGDDVVRSAAEVESGNAVSIRVAEGTFEAIVE